MRPRGALPGLLPGLLLVALSLPVLGGWAPTYAAGEAPCDPAILADTERTADVAVRIGRPAARMHVPEAQRYSTGAGVTVAVLDSGVGEGLGIDARVESVPGFEGPLLSGHGTLVAGLIAGPDGVAPDASVLSMRVLDKNEPNPDMGERGVSSTAMAVGLQRLADLHGQVGFDIVNVSLTVPGDDPALRAAIKRIQRLGVLVVAASGNADADTDQPNPGTASNDAEVYPADYPGVVAVSAVASVPGVDLRDYVRPNAETTVAAPTDGAISVNLNGQRCQVVGEIATSYAAAQVSGVLALLRARFPRETPRQLVARLTETAEGSGAAADPWSGAGVVQAADALTHELAPARDGELARSSVEPGADAQAPVAPERPDLHGTSRTVLLWAAVLGGALAVLAFVLRPLLKPRRARAAQRR